MDYDVIVIGAGAGGLVAAKGAAGVGKSVLLIESDRIGGDCTHYGCVPSKALIACAKTAYTVKGAERFGVKTGKISVSWKNVREYMQGHIDYIASKTSPEELTKAGVEVLFGQASFVDGQHVRVDKQVFSAKKIVLCTGASAFIPPITGIEEVKYHTNKTIFFIEKQPKKLVILGAGPIGLEIGQAFSRLGSQVTIIDRSSRIFTKEDRDVSEYMQKVLEEEGILFKLNTNVTSAKNTKLGVALHTSKGVVEGDMLLVATGRRANLPDGLVEAGIETEAGFVKIDEYMQTTNKNVYACGDVCTPYQFSHYAEHQARAIVMNAFLPVVRKKAEANVIPWVTFTDPEVAHVGVTEQELKDAGKTFREYKNFFSGSDRAITDGDTKGFVKLHVTSVRGKILGATIVGAQAGEIINEVSLAMQQGTPVNKLSSLIHPYPTRALVVRAAADKYFKETVAGWFKK